MSERRLMLFGEVNPQSVLDLIDAIESINEEDGFNLQNVIGYEPEPIKLIVNSTGGSVNDGFALIDVIENSITPIYTVCYGSAFSMALAIFLAGGVKYSGLRSTFMYHQLRHAFEGTSGEHTINTNELLRLQKIYNEYILNKTNLTPEDLKDVGTTDWYMSAEEAINFGIVDHILDPNAELEEEIED